MNNKPLNNTTPTFNNKIVSIYYDGSVNKEIEIDLLTKEKLRLESSISRRTILLKNEEISFTFYKTAQTGVCGIREFGDRNHRKA